MLVSLDAEMITIMIHGKIAILKTNLQIIRPMEVFAVRTQCHGYIYDLVPKYLIEGLFAEVFTRI